MLLSPKAKKLENSTLKRGGKDMSSVKVVALDFDNCIALDEETGEGSEEIKDGAWFKVFPEYKRRALDPVIKQAQQKIKGGKGDRKDIAESVLLRFNFPEDKVAEEAVRRCDRFNAIVQEGIKGIRISARAKRAIAELSDNFSLFLNTATPSEAAKESLQALGIDTFFKGIYGRPGTKIDNLRDIIAGESIKPSELLFVDDQQTAWEISKEIGCQFVGIQTKRNKLWQQNPQPFPVIYSLIELLGIVWI